MASDDDTLFEFPCRFPLKAMGRVADDFEATVVAIVRRHVSAVTPSESS